MLLNLPDELSVSIFNFFTRPDLCRLQLKNKCFNLLIQRYFWTTPPYFMIRILDINKPNDVTIGNVEGIDKEITLNEAVEELSGAKYLRANVTYISFQQENGDNEQLIDIGYGPFRPDQIHAISHVWSDRPLRLYFFSWRPTLLQLSSGFGGCSEMECNVRKAQNLQNFHLPQLPCNILEIQISEEEVAFGTLMEWLWSPQMYTSIAQRRDYHTYQNYKYLSINLSFHKWNIQKCVEQIQENFCASTQASPFPFVVEFFAISARIFKQQIPLLMASVENARRNGQTNELLVAMKRKKCFRVFILGRIPAAKGGDEAAAEEFKLWMEQTRFCPPP